MVRRLMITGETADIGGDGEKWSAYGGKISGRNIELVPGKRIAQTWRAGNWAEGVHGIGRSSPSTSGRSLPRLPLRRAALVSFPTTNATTR